MTAEPRDPSAGEGAPRASRFQVVDVLRGIAVLMVIAFHVDDSLAGAAGAGESPWRVPFMFGWTGVPLFFVLSGFCIHHSYLQSPRFDAREFLRRRFWRIYPAYFVALLACSVVSLKEAKLDAEQFFSHALLVHNFSDRTIFGVNVSFWSLATEMQLYLLYPLLLLLRRRWGIAGALGVTLVVALAWRLTLVNGLGFVDRGCNWLLASPLATWFGWTLGALVAERFHEGRRTFAGSAAWLVALPFVFALSADLVGSTILEFSLAALISAVALDAALQRPSGDALWSRGLAFVGVLSYSLYLWHLPIVAGVAPLAVGPRVGPVATIGVYLAAALVLGALAWLSYRCAEQPGVAIGRAIHARTTHAPKPAPSAASPSVAIENSASEA